MDLKSLLPQNFIDLNGLKKTITKIREEIKTNSYTHPMTHPATMIVQDNNNQFVTKEQKDQWTNKLDPNTNIATNEEVEALLNEKLIKEVLELATEQDIKLLFENSSIDQVIYNLSSLSPDETKIVNMKLLSLFHDLMFKKIDEKDTILKTNLESSINTKEDKTVVSSLITNLKNELTNSINNKMEKNTTLSLGKGLSGSSNFNSEVAISLNIATNEEVEKLFEGELL